MCMAKTSWCRTGCGARNRPRCLSHASETADAWPRRQRCHTKKGITAPVLVVRSFEDLKQRAGEARGKIVLFYPPSSATARRWRIAGAALPKPPRPARSPVWFAPLPLRAANAAHRMMNYEEGVPRIPYAAITIEDAERLQRWQDAGTVCAAEHVGEASAGCAFAQCGGRTRRP